MLNCKKAKIGILLFAVLVIALNRVQVVSYANMLYFYIGQLPVSDVMALLCAWFLPVVVGATFLLGKHKNYLILASSLMIVSLVLPLLFFPSPTRYVTPSDATVVSLAHNIVNSFAGLRDNSTLTDMELVEMFYLWTAFNVNYTLSDNHFKLPVETINSRQGVCRDAAALLCSLLRVYNIDAYVTKIDFKGEVGHMIVVIPASGGYSIVENKISTFVNAPAICILDIFGHTTGYYDSTLFPVPILLDDALSWWIKEWGKDEENVRFLSAFNEKEAFAFTNNMQFKNWVTNHGKPISVGLPGGYVWKFGDPTKEGDKAYAKLKVFVKGITP